MQLSLSVYESSRVIWGKNTPSIIEAIYTYTIKCLMRTEEIQSRESQRNCILIVTQVYFRSSRQRFFQNHATIKFLASPNNISVYHQSSQFGMNVKNRLLSNSAHLARIKLYNMIKHLHDNGSVSESHRPSINKRF